MFQQTIRSTWSTPGGAPLAREVTQVGSVAPALRRAIADGAEDLEVNFACDNATLALLYLVSDKDLTVLTNSDTAPDDTFTLKAGVPLVWHKDDPAAPNPLSAPIARLFVSNASGVVATLEIRALHQ